MRTNNQENERVCDIYVIRFLRIITILLLLVVVVARSIHSPQFLYIAAVLLLLLLRRWKRLSRVSSIGSCHHLETYKSFFVHPLFSIPSFPLYKFLWLFFLLMLILFNSKALIDFFSFLFFLLNSFFFNPLN